jgi:hypothetical protein
MAGRQCGLRHPSSGHYPRRPSNAGRDILSRRPPAPAVNVGRAIFSRPPPATAATAVYCQLFTSSAAFGHHLDTPHFTDTSAATSMLPGRKFTNLAKDPGPVRQ